ncbi:hypothetical protein, partial [Micromonospora arida]
RVLLPHVQLRIVEYGVVHPVPLHRGGERVGVEPDRSRTSDVLSLAPWVALLISVETSLRG